MTAFRRLEWNFALERAVEWARSTRRPLLVLEALRVDYPWASRRMHRFVLDGMADHRVRLEGTRVGYYPYVEPERGAGKGLVEALGRRAAVVVTDDYPAFFLPRMARAAARKVPVLLEAVDSNGLLPVQAPEEGRVFTTAYSFRRYLQKTLPDHLYDSPREHPLTGDPLPAFEGIPDEIRRRWPPTSKPPAVAEDPGPVSYGGGAEEGTEVLEAFLERGLGRYAEDRNDPDLDVPSGLSPWLHWGHISTHEVFDAVARAERWNPGRLSGTADGSRKGWWGMSPGAEAFLDQLITWRELGFNGSARMEGWERWESLPDWARDTLEEHASDERPHLYTMEQFRAAETHDELWNAAQRQLLREGRIHNYLRMLWGKKILEWSEHPKEALEIMIELNNRYAVDGRDPNSYSGIFWVLGRYDRGWPERPVFGKVRSMSSDATRRKVTVEGYLKRFGR
jgi:deoxyribodipyrimidine photo-lyase